MNAADLQPVTLGHHGLFESALNVQKRWSCECNFANIYAWSTIYDTVFAVVAGRVVVCNRHVGVLLFPFGEWLPPKELETLRRELSAAIGTTQVWGDVPHEYIAAHGAELETLYQVSTTADEDDYILKVAEIATLEGRKHQNTRRLIRQFGDHALGWRIAPVTAANRLATRDLAMQLLSSKGVSPFGADEAVALHRAFESFATLGLEGLLLTAADGTPLAFSLFSFTRPEVANIHFEKAVRDIPGASQTIRVSLARYLTSRCQWMNLEQDLGDPGLRHSKQSYNPAQLLPRYRLQPLAGT